MRRRRILSAIRVAKAKEAGIKSEDIKGIAISGLYGGSGIPLDENMEPVRPCMIWMDRRADEETKWGAGEYRRGEAPGDYL